MSANYRNPNFLLPNEVNMATNPDLSVDRHSLYSMEFDNSSISLGTSVDLGLNSTVSLWAKFDSFGAVLIGELSYSSSYLFYIDGSNIYIRIAGVYGTFAHSLSTNQWYNIIIVREGVPIEVFINGTSIGTSTGDNGTYDTSINTKFDTLGNKPAGATGGSFPFRGDLDEFAGWNKALSAIEVAALSTANAPVNIMAFNPKPYLYLPLGEQARVGGDENPNTGGSEWQFPNQSIQSTVIDFDGTDEIVVTQFTLTGALSLSAWIKPDTLTGGQAMLFGDNDSNGYKIEFNGTTTIAIKNAGGNTSFTGAAWNTNKWQHLLITRDASDNVTIYRNGASWSTGTKSGNILFDRISGFNNSASHFDGEMSNIAVWNSDQTSEKDNIYNNGSPATSYTNTPTAWYKLNAANSSYAPFNANFNSALSFDGNDYIDTGASSFSGLTEMSVSAWVKPTATGTGAAEAILSTEAASPNRGFYLSLFVGSKYRWQVSTDGNNKDSLDAGVIVLNKWTHIAATWNQSTMNLYINGVLADTMSTVNATGTFSSTNNMFIGQRTSGAGYFPGDVSNVALFTQVISAEDILYLYNGGTPQTSLSFEPTSWYKLDNLTTGIQDSGSASNNGTNNGATEVTDSVAVDQWNFDNVSHAQTPTYTKCLQTTTTADRVLTGGITAPSMDYIYLSTWYRSTDTLEKILFSNNLAKLYVGTTRVYITTHHGAVYRSFPVQVMDGNWHHIIYGFPNTGGSVTLTDMKVWVDGKEIAGANAGGSSMTGNVTSINGLYTGTGQNPASVSNYSFFNTDISSNIATMYNNGTPGDISSLNPYLWYKLNNTASSSSSDGLYDNGSGGNNGTLSGTWNNINTNVLTSRLNGGKRYFTKYSFSKK